MLQDLRRRLRPMGFADILDEAFELYKRNFLLLLGIGACAYVPVALAEAAMGAPTQFSGAESQAIPTAAEFARLLIYLALAWLALVLATGALTFATSDRYLERRTSVGSCYRRVAKPSLVFSFAWANSLWLFAMMAAFLAPLALFGISIFLLVVGGRGGDSASVLLGVLMLLVGFVLLCVPAYIASRFAVYAPAFFVEGRGAAASLSRSWQLLKGRVLSTFGMVSVVFVVVIVVKLVVLSPFSLLMAKSSLEGAEPSAVSLAIYTSVNAAVNAILMPMESVVLILIYYDTRIRKEGFDLEMLAADLDQQARQSPYDTHSLPQESDPTQDGTPEGQET